MESDMFNNLYNTLNLRLLASLVVYIIKQFDSLWDSLWQSIYWGTVDDVMENLQSSKAPYLLKLKSNHLKVVENDKKAIVEFFRRFKEIKAS